MLDFAGRFGVFWVVSVDVVARNEEGKETVDDGNNTIFNVVNLLFAKFGREFELVVDKGIEDEPSDGSATEKDEFVFKGFESHLLGKKLL